MPSRALPGLGLIGFFDLGEDGWDDEMSNNLRVLSALVQARVLDIVDADPGAPANGDIYFFSDAHPTNAEKLAIRDNGAWVYIPAFAGMLIYNIADDTYYTFDGADLVEFAGGGGGGFSLPVVTTDADDYTVLAADNNKYIRLTAAGTKDIIVQDEATEALPANGEWHFRNVGAGDATFDDTDVTINVPAGGTLVVPQGGTVTLKRVAADEFDLFGVTVAA